MATTKSTSKTATATQSAPKPHTVKAGGDKGKAIVELMKSEPSLTRAQLAEKVGATVGRVGEVVRWLAANGTADEKKIVANHVKAQPVRKAAEKKATPTKQAAPSKSGAKKASAPRKPAAKKAAAPAESPAPVEG